MSDVSSNIVRFPRGLVVGPAIVANPEGNAEIRGAGAWLAQVPDCDTDRDVIIGECLPNRLRCAICERNPVNLGQ